MKYYESTELELTSIDEVNSLVLQMNIEMLCQNDVDQVLNSNENTQIKMHHPESFAINYNTKNVNIDVHEGGNVCIDEHKDINEPRTTRIRFQGTATLDAINKKFQPNPIATGTSKLVIEPIPAKIQAHHELLRQLAQCSYLSDKYKKICKKAFRVALLRGKQYKCSEPYPFSEELYLEFKGKSTDEQLSWPYKNFQNIFTSESVENISAFINRVVIDDKKPDVPARIIFGIRDDTNKVHGVWDTRRQTEDVYDYKIKQALLSQNLCRALTDKLVPKPPGWVEKIISAVTVELKEVTLSNDILSKHPMRVAFLVTVSIDLNQLDMLYPTAVKTKAGPTYFIRTLVPETKNVINAGSDIYQKFKDKLFVYQPQPLTRSSSA
jgi:hypothetical protein